MKVMKFGGSTFKDPKMMKEVGGIIKNQKGKKVIVVSALFGQTNEIREYLRKIRTEKEEIEAFIYSIRYKHKYMINNAIPDKGIAEEVFERVNSIILKLERLLYGVAYTEELTPRTADIILSSGERMSAHIMEGVLRCADIEAKAYEADKIGILTDGVFLNATADLKETENNLKETIALDLKSNIVPVITGFFGCDKEGRTTTFGKNGSDYSAAVIANALNAEKLELWKDVDGFMSADPGMVSKAHTINKLSYDEAAELAYYGIGILHPRTVGPASVKGIPIVIKNILKPNGEGTTILKKGYQSENVIKSVVYSTDLVEIKVSGAGAGYRSGVLSIVASTLGKSNINIYSVLTSQTHLSLLIHKNDLINCLNALDEIIYGAIERIEYFKNIALVCVVGEGSRKNMGLAKKIFSSVADAGVNVEIISAGASSVASHFIVKKEGLKKTVSAIHSAFCEG